MLGRPIGWALKAVHVRSDAEAAALEDARKDVLEAGLRRTPRWPHGCGSWTAALVVLGDPAVALPSTAGAPPPDRAPGF